MTPPLPAATLPYPEKQKSHEAQNEENLLFSALRVLCAPCFFSFLLFFPLIYCGELRDMNILDKKSRPARKRLCKKDRPLKF
jgi:hypothetical protein